MSLRKRGADDSDGRGKRSAPGSGFASEEKEEVLEFEDPFGDDLEDEEMQDVDADNAGARETAANGEDAEMDADEDGDANAAELEEEEDDDDDEEEDSRPTKVFMPGVDRLEADEVLDYDTTAYDMYFAMSAEWPALSIDVLRDNLGTVRSKFPMTVYVAAGTQAPHGEANQISLLKMSELHKQKHEDSDSEGDDEDDEDDDDDVDGDPVLESRTIPHKGGVNRIRAMPQASNVVATWSDLRKVHVWDVSKHLASLDSQLTENLPTKTSPMYTFSGHADEGFALDWSSVNAGQLVTGDCSKFIYVWMPAEGTWRVDKVPYTGHRASVEDLQWSPTEASVFASCSADRSVRIWDARRKAGSMLDVDAHDDDVNVISWNHNVAYLLASGSDDGSFKIWDLRNFRADNPVAHFRYHTAPITSIEWHPTDESTLAASGADNQISVWDMSVEEDAEAAPIDASHPETTLPPQLLFVHQGQTDIKELHFHPQCPGVLVSTASDGFNVFKPANIS